MMGAMAGLRSYRRWEWEVEGGEVVVVSGFACSLALLPF